MRYIVMTLVMLATVGLWIAATIQLALTLTPVTNGIIQFMLASVAAAAGLYNFVDAIIDLVILKTRSTNDIRAR